MYRKLNIIIIRTMLCVLLLSLSTRMFAHEGFQHVSGTIEKVAGKVLTVKTANGSVDVKLNDKTEITHNNKKALVADLKLGYRVVVDVMEGDKSMTAHSVKIGAAPPAAAAATAKPAPASK